MSQQFVVHGIDASLARVALPLAAESASAAAVAARGLGVEPTRIARDWGGELRLRATRRAFPAALFFRELALLTRAGLSVSVALQSLLEKEAHAAHQAVLKGMLTSLAGGGTVAQALARYPQHFPPVARSAVESAEGAGALADVLDRLGAYLEQGEELRRRVVGALLYPVLVVAVGALVCGYLMFFVVPRFAEVYRDLGDAMPWVAQWLVAWADLLAGHRFATYVAVSIPGLAVTLILLDPATRQRALALVARLKPIARRVEQFERVRLYRGIAMLLASGTSFSRALITLEASVSPLMHGRVRQARTLIEGGAAVSDALKHSGLASSVTVRLLAAGEQSGAMVESMSRIANMLEADLTRDTEWLLKVLEPLLMLAVGIVVGGIVLLLYLPIFELANAVG